jgi:hypothetical protein
MHLNPRSAIEVSIVCLALHRIPTPVDEGVRNYSLSVPGLVMEVSFQ